MLCTCTSPETDDHTHACTHSGTTEEALYRMGTIAIVNTGYKFRIFLNFRTLDLSKFDHGPLKFELSRFTCITYDCLGDNLMLFVNMLCLNNESGC